MSSENEEDETLPYEEPPSSPEISAFDVVSYLKGLSRTHQENGENKFRVRRKRCFDDFIEKANKSWFKPSKEVIVTFIGEASVDTGGPRREFFTCE